MDQKVFGYEACRDCDAPVLDIVAAKTSGLCPEHFRARTNPFLRAVVAHNNDGDRIKLRLVTRKRSPGHKAAKRRARSKEQARKARAAQAAALRRLRHIYPDVYEALLADERAERGLEAWTIERALTPHRPYSSFDDLAKYAGLDNPLAS